LGERLGCGGAAGGGKRRGTSRPAGWARKQTGQMGLRFKRQIEKDFKFLKTLEQSNSNLDLNSNTSKQCTGMNATVNSYISLIN
jgi:hypothetical protein